MKTKYILLACLITATITSCNKEDPTNPFRFAYVDMSIDTRKDSIIPLDTTREGKGGGFNIFLALDKRGLNKYQAWDWVSMASMRLKAGDRISYIQNKAKDKKTDPDWIIVARISTAVENPKTKK